MLNEGLAPFQPFQTSYKYNIGFVFISEMQHLASREILLNDAAEDFARKLLTLIVADDADLNLLLVAEILVIAHLARDEGIGTCLDGCVEQESTRIHRRVPPS